MLCHNDIYFLKLSLLIKNSTLIEVKCNLPINAVKGDTESIYI